MQGDIPVRAHLNGGFERDSLGFMSCGQDLDSDLEEAPSWDFCFHLRPKSTEGQNNLNEVNTFMFNTLYSLAM